MSVLDDVIDESGIYDSEEVYYGESSKRSLEAIASDINENYKPKTGSLCINFIFQSKYPVGSAVLKRCADYITQNAKKVEPSAIGPCACEHLEDHRKFYMGLLFKGIDIDVVNFLENMKPYLIPESSMDIIDIGVSYLAK